MKKVVHVGRIVDGGHFGRWKPHVFCEIEYVNGKLSIHGVIGPKSNGNAVGGAGQIDMEFTHRNPADDDHPYQNLIQPGDIEFAPGWSRKTWLNFLDVWKRWHLNDMRPGCEHQREWDTGAEIVIQHYSWSKQYYALRRLVESGKATVEEYLTYQAASVVVAHVTTGLNSPKSPLFPEVQDALAAGWIKEDRQETKAAGWLRWEEHPGGLLCKPCPVCGYKYGSAWRMEDVPADVIAFLESLPETDITPAWV